MQRRSPSWPGRGCATASTASTAPAPPLAPWAAVGRSVGEFVKKHSKAIGFGGYVLITIQWLMDDVLMLRCFGVMCATSMAIFAYFQPVPLMVPVRFNILFICINGLYITRILLERRDLTLNPTEQALWDLGFGAFLTKVQLRELLAVGKQRQGEPSMLVAQAGTQIQPRVMVLVSGGMVQSRNGTQIGTFEPGDFWGEFQLLESSRQNEEHYKVTTKFSKSSTIVQWDKEQLSEYLSRRPVLKQRLQALWAEGLNVKLDRNHAKANERAYSDILRGILCAGNVGEAELNFLKHVREVQSLSDDCHTDALQKLGYSEADFAKLVTRGRRSWFSRWVGRQASFPSSLAFKQEPKWAGQESWPQWPGSPKGAARSPMSMPLSPVALPRSPVPKSLSPDHLHVSGRWETGWSDTPHVQRNSRRCFSVGRSMAAPSLSCIDSPGGTPHPSTCGTPPAMSRVATMPTDFGRRSTC